ncbi:MAG TPA: helix-turn-helix domain-containing protein [Acidobacteriota bacterium]|nr:helix-turn-helix domain-containing protein [Acidobacteriota bacterium]
MGEIEKRERFIRSAVDGQGYSQSEVARFLGINQSTVSRILGGGNA